MFDFLLDLFSFDLLGLEAIAFLPMLGIFGRIGRRKRRRRQALAALTSRIRRADYDMISRVQRGLQIRRLKNDDIYRPNLTGGRSFNMSETPEYYVPGQTTTDVQGAFDAALNNTGGSVNP